MLDGALISTCKGYKTIRFRPLLDDFHYQPSFLRLGRRFLPCFHEICRRCLAACWLEAVALCWSQICCKIIKIYMINPIPWIWWPWIWYNTPQKPWCARGFTIKRPGFFVAKQRGMGWLTLNSTVASILISPCNWASKQYCYDHTSLRHSETKLHSWDDMALIQRHNLIE